MTTPQPWVTPQEVLNRWLPAGSEPTNETDRLAIIIADIEDSILSRIPGIQTRIDSGDLRINTVKRVVSGAVIRVWKTEYNPLSSYSETEGPFSMSGSMNERVSRGASITDDELQELLPTVNPHGAFSVTTSNPWTGVALEDKYRRVII